jgi:glycosyltransferase involved in cell wall biosynthesis
MTKILIFSENFYPSIGGTQRSSQILARELTRQGVSVCVLTSTRLPRDKEEIEEGYTVIREPTPASILKHAFSSDLVISKGGVSLKVGIPTAVLRKRFVIFHEMIPSWPPNNRVPRIHFKESLKRRIADQAILNVAVSNTVLNQLPPKHKRRGCCIYNPIDPDLWEASPPNFYQRHFDVSFIGRITSGKGVFVLQEAISLLTERTTPSIAIVGSGPQEQELRNNIGKLGCRASFLGELSGTALREVYARSRVVVVPSVHAEGAPMVAVEALASGTPICISAQPALQEVAGPAGIVHEVGDAKALSKQLHELLSSPEAWRIMSEKAINRRGIFSLHGYRQAIRDHILRPIDAPRHSL